MADTVQFLLELGRLERREGQREKAVDVLFEERESSGEGAVDFTRWDGDRGEVKRIGDTPVGGDGMAGPLRAGGVTGIVPYSDDALHGGGVGTGEFVP